MEASQTFQEHIHELRKRLFWVAIAVIVSASVAYGIRNPVLKLLQHPLNETLFYSSPAGGFNFVIRLSMIIGLFITLPVMIYQLLRFIEPALPRRIRPKTFIKIIGSSFILACLGIAFGYFYMIPTSLQFFGGYSTSEIKPLISADSYLSFVINNLITFALSFQIPMLILFINKIKPMGPKSLLKYQRHVIVGAFVLALLLPFTYDPISQFMVAVPIVFLFYLSVILLWIANRKTRKFAKKVESKPKPIFTPPLVQEKPIRNNPSPTPQHIPQFRPAISLDGFVKPRQRVAYTRVASPISTSVQVRPKPTANRTIHRKILSIDGFVPLNRPIHPQAS